MELRILLAEVKSLMAELDKFRPLSAEILKKDTEITIIHLRSSPIICAICEKKQQKYVSKHRTKLENSPLRRMGKTLFCQVKRLLTS